MKILVIGFGKISYMPYMNLYTEVLGKLKTEFEIRADLIYWERDNKIDLDVPKVYDNAYKFVSHIEESEGFIRKIPSFLRYRKFAKKIIKKNKYDKLIILHSTPGLVLLNYLRKYKNKYILDYRDFSHENIKIYKVLVSKLVKMAKVTFISSDGYREYLPKIDEIFTTHNLLRNSIDYRDVSSDFRKIRNPIIIRYWGLIRHSEINLKIIKKIAYDSRFELHYHGREQQNARILKKYCEENNIKNIFFHGEYLPDERNSFAKETHVIHNVYENTQETVNAMSNKYYDGIIYKIPQICNEGSYMGKKIEGTQTGLSINPDDIDFTDKIYNYYMTINFDSFDKNCDSVLNEVLQEHDKNYNIIESFIRYGGE